ncbi:ABC transporter ATP-binding protein [Anaerorhabdus sp.]|uniref:ABC transporter ATP-binding protein n=1 Tax=Anaerorhabdus sp. TaxID=1872524 RepID=UPI002FC5D1E2
MIEIKNCNVIFNKNTVNENHALKDINLKLEDGDFVTVIGSNGAGKSTLLNVICGSVETESGQVFVDQQNITKFKEHKRANLIGRLSQDPLKGTAPHMTIEENCLLAYGRGTKRKLRFSISNDEKELFYNQCLKLNLGLENRMKTEVGFLSGGQRQALTLLMSTMIPPQCLLLDEHTAALDPKTAENIMKITNDIIQEHHITTLMITHNIDHALQYGNKTIIMNEGRILDIIEGEQRKSMTKQDVLKYYEKINGVLTDKQIL